MKSLYLSGLNYELDLVKEDRYRIYYNKERNVAIFAVNYCPREKIFSVFNGISEEAYEQLIDFMNINDNLIVYWTKVEGTTSDYTIYCDCDYEEDWNIIDLDEYLWCLREGESNTFKYNIVKDGELTPFKVEKQHIKNEVLSGERYG